MSERVRRSRVWIATLGVALVVAGAAGCGKVNAKCSPGFALCDGQCVDVATSSANCGACGMACGATQTCTAGVCGCGDTSLAACGAECVDLKSSAAHCGVCGNACQNGKTCSGGSCACAAPLTDCAGACVNLDSNASNCGACSNACMGGKVCNAKVCACATGQTECSGVCVDLTMNISNCGQCGNACLGGKTCAAGSCACPSGQEECAGLCVDKATNNSNCGVCGRACSGGSNCVGGTCSCPDGESDCSGVCANLQTSNSDCGICGRACSGGRSCVAGNCACPGAQGECGGTCFNIATDRAHCGSSCSVCTTNQLCDNGCATAPPLTFLTKWNDPTGRKDSAGNDLRATFDTAGLPSGTVFKCRTGKLVGPGLAYAGTAPAFATCDPAGYVIAPSEDGSYRTEVFYQADTFISATSAYEFYVHKSLDGVATCPSNDDLYFNAAKAFNAASSANAVAFPLTGQFPAPAAVPKRTDAIFLRNPWWKVPFTGVSPSVSIAVNPGPWTTPNVVVEELSLRHKLVLNGNTISGVPLRSMLLMRRNYEHPSAAAGNKCKNIEAFGGKYGEGVGPPSLNRGEHKLDCQAIVISATNGAGLCFASNGTPQVIDSRVAKPANLAGTVTTTIGSATVTGSGTAFVTNGSWNNAFILFSGSVSWYQINNVNSATSLTLKTVAPNVAPDFGGAGQTYTVALSSAPVATQVTPSGYAKLLSQNLKDMRSASNATSKRLVGNKCTGDAVACGEVVLEYAGAATPVHFLPP